jgi:hypothetical protein
MLVTLGGTEISSRSGSTIMAGRSTVNSWLSRFCTAQKHIQSIYHSFEISLFGTRGGNMQRDSTLEPPAVDSKPTGQKEMGRAQICKHPQVRRDND